jgi:NodT family efflux transporter outer membrane factor (OMF) lipoprotein
MRKSYLATSFLTALVLAGCAISPDPPPQTMAIPVAWKAFPATGDTLGQPLLVAWWHAYNDATLNRIMEQAHIANTDVRLAATRVAQAWASVDAARAQRRPVVGLNTSAERRRLPATRLPGSTEPNVVVPPSIENQFNVGLQANFELDLVGRLGKGTASAQALFRASEFDALAARLAVTNAVFQAWADVRLAERRHDIASQLVLTANTIAEGEYKRVVAGIGTAQTGRDATQVTVEARQKQIDAMRDREQGLAQLALLTGEFPVDFAARWAVAANDISIELKIVPDLPARVVAHRPDIQAQWCRLLGAVTDVERAQLERYPTLNLTSTLGFLADSLTSWLKRDAVNWTLAAIASIPLLDGGKIAARVDQSKAIRSEREVLYRQSVLTALQEVESGLIQWQAVTAQVSLAKDFYASRTRDVADTHQFVQAGTLNILDYSKAQLRLLDAAESLAIAQRNVTVVYGSLNTSLGRK